MKVLGEDNSLSMMEFIHRIRAEWRKVVSDLDKVDMILELLHPKIHRELKLQDDCINLEEMLETE